jgi:2-hydroxychromene-2-carboxylate isomerase
MADVRFPVDTPVPVPQLVTAARQHLTERYAAGVYQVLWQTEQRPMPDPDAVKAVIAADGGADPLDIGSALLLVQAIRMGLDQLEYDLFEAAREAGITDAAIAAVLGLPDEAAARARQRWLTARLAIPSAEPAELKAEA